MTCDGSSEKYISVAFEKLSITSSDKTSSQAKNDSENPPPLQSQILSAIQKIRKSKTRADVKSITKKIKKTSRTTLDDSYIAVNISQLLDKKLIANVKTQQHLDYFHLSTIEITSKDNLSLQVGEILSNDSKTLEKSSNETKITTCHTNEISTIVQQFTSDDPIPSDIHTPITENHCAAISASSIDESFEKLELKIYELNHSVNSELAFLNKNWILFLNISINLSTVDYLANKKNP